MGPLRYEIALETDGRWRWRLLRPPGMAVSVAPHGHRTRLACERALLLTRVQARFARPVLRVTPDGTWEWSLVTPAGQALARSARPYTDRMACAMDAGLVRRAALDAVGPPSTAGPVAGARPAAALRPGHHRAPGRREPLRARLQDWET